MLRCRAIDWAGSPSYNDPIVRATPLIGSFRWRLLSFPDPRRSRTISRFDHLHRLDGFSPGSGPSRAAILLGPLTARRRPFFCRPSRSARE
jgi:hypothetical protein